MRPPYQFLLYSRIERLVFACPRPSPLAPARPPSCVPLYPLLVPLPRVRLLFSSSRPLLSVSNNWTGPHSALSHGHISLPASTCLYLPACLPGLPARLPFLLPWHTADAFIPLFRIDTHAYRSISHCEIRYTLSSTRARMTIMMMVVVVVVVAMAQPMKD